MKQYVDGNKRTVDALRNMKASTYDLESALLNGNLGEFGRIIKQVEVNQRQYHTAVYPNFVNNIFDIARQNGAIGGKLAGAGGGGCAYFFCEEGKRDNVKEAFKANKIPLIPMEFANEGVTIWHT